MVFRIFLGNSPRALEGVVPGGGGLLLFFFFLGGGVVVCGVWGGIVVLGRVSPCRSGSGSRSRRWEDEGAPFQKYLGGMNQRGQSYRF